MLAVCRTICLLIVLANVGFAGDAGDVSRYKAWPLESVEVTGIETVGGNVSAAGLASASTLFPDVVRDDVERLRLQLARLGYPRSVVLPRVEPVSGERRVRLFFDVDLGAPAVVRSVDVVGGIVVDGLSISDWLDLVDGEPFRDDALTTSVDELEARLRLAGYARAEVSSTVRAADDDGVAVTIAVDAGDTYAFGGVRVVGARDDLVRLVARVSDVEPGDAYSTDALARARYQIQLLSLFSRIQLSTVDTAPGTLDLVVDVTERPFRAAEAGVGYWTDDLFRLQASWQHQNLFSRGRGFRAEGFLSSRRRRAASALWWPGIAGARVIGRLRGSIEEELEDTYDLVDVGADASLTYRHSVSTTLSTGLSLSWVTVDEKTDDAVFEEDGGRILAGHVSWRRVTTDDPIDPTRGSDVDLRVSRTVPGSWTETEYVRSELDAKAYVAPMNDVVVAGRVSGGVARPLGDSADLLPNIRFYAGGGRSMRGFARRRLGPLDSANDPVGGEAVVELSAEVRVPVWWRVRAAGFVDAAQVWADRSDVALDDLEMAVGPALMVSTPVGPIRADLGVRLGTIDDTEPRTAFHLSIGHPF